MTFFGDYPGPNLYVPWRNFAHIMRIPLADVVRDIEEGRLQTIREYGIKCVLWDDKREPNRQKVVETLLLMGCPYVVDHPTDYRGTPEEDDPKPDLQPISRRERWNSGEYAMRVRLAKLYVDLGVRFKPLKKWRVQHVLIEASADNFRGVFPISDAEVDEARRRGAYYVGLYPGHEDDVYREVLRYLHGWVSQYRGWWQGYRWWRAGL
jgi:hypothetical protein